MSARPCGPGRGRRLPAWLPALILLFTVACQDPRGPGNTADRSGSVAVPAPELSAAEPLVASALEQARQSVITEPSASAWGHLAMVFDADGFVQEAVICYRQAAELASWDYRWPYLAARALRREDLDQALADFRRAAELRPDNVAVYIQFGDALLDAAQTAAADQQYERARQLAPDSPWATFGLGRTALREGRLEDARQHLEEALTRRWNFREGHTLLAQVCQRLGDQDQARLHMWIAGNHPDSGAPPDAAYDAVVKRGVSSRWASRRGRLYARGGSYEAAEKEFRQVVAALGDDVIALSNLGGALAGQGRVEEALELYDRALALDPDEVLVRNNLAQALIRRGDLDLAGEHLETALEIDQLDVQVLLNLGLVRSRQGRMEEAVEFFRTALQVQPGDLEGLNRLAHAMAARGQSAEATELWRRAHRIDPSNLETLYNLAGVLSTQGEHGDTIGLLRQGMARAANSSRLAVFLAWELAVAPDETLRDGAAAVRLASRVRRAYPQQAQAADVLAAALAETGDFEGAIREGQAAAQLTQAQGQSRLVAQIRARVRGYHKGVPYRAE